MDFMDLFFSGILKKEDITGMPIVLIQRGLRLASGFLFFVPFLFMIRQPVSPEWRLAGIFTGIILLLLALLCYLLQRIIIIEENRVLVTYKFLFKFGGWTEPLKNYKHISYFARERTFQWKRSPEYTHSYYIYLSHPDTTKNVLLYQQGGEEKMRVLLIQLADLLKMPIVEEKQNGVIQYTTEDINIPIKGSIHKDSISHNAYLTKYPPEISVKSAERLTEICFPSKEFWLECHEYLVAIPFSYLLVAIFWFYTDWILFQLLFSLLAIGVTAELFRKWSKQTQVLRITDDSILIAIRDIWGRENTMVAIPLSEVLYLKKEPEQSHYKNCLTIVTKTRDYHIGRGLNTILHSYLEEIILHTITELPLAGR